MCGALSLKVGVPSLGRAAVPFPAETAPCRAPQPRAQCRRQGGDGKMPMRNKRLKTPAVCLEDVRRTRLSLDDVLLPLSIEALRLEAARQHPGAMRSVPLRHRDVARVALAAEAPLPRRLGPGMAERSTALSRRRPPGTGSRPHAGGPADGKSVPRQTGEPANCSGEMSCKRQCGALEPSLPSLGDAAGGFGHPSAPSLKARHGGTSPAFDFLQLHQARTCRPRSRASSKTVARSVAISAAPMQATRRQGRAVPEGG